MSCGVGSETGSWKTKNFDKYQEPNQELIYLPQQNCRFGERNH